MYKERWLQNSLNNIVLGHWAKTNLNIFLEEKNGGAQPSEVGKDQ